MLNTACVSEELVQAAKAVAQLEPAVEAFAEATGALGPVRESTGSSSSTRRSSLSLNRRRPCCWNVLSELQNADRVLTERTQAMFAKAEIPEEFVQSELQRLTQLAERGEEDPDAPGYFSMRPNP